MQTCSIQYLNKKLKSKRVFISESFLFYLKQKQLLLCSDKVIRPNILGKIFPIYLEQKSMKITAYKKTIYKNMNLTLWNNSFDKNRLKTFVSWFLKTYGEKKTIQLLEELKNLGFGYATQAGVSLGIDDLLIPTEKMEFLYSSNKNVLRNNFKYRNAKITAVEKVQLFIDNWNETSENLKKEVIKNFEKTNIFNPVYMMAFSGARGNISQVRQLVGMRGLMSDPQGNIIDFPIQSNFKEGLTLTEYIISTYGARKGIVDTALRTATAGYLTRRLVDVAQHVMISLFDCKTNRGIFLFDMKEGSQILYSFQNRLVGRVLANDIKILNKETSNFTLIGSRNQEISISLANKIVANTKKAFVRSPLTCQSSKFICQLCYGWSLSSNKLVSLGEAIGVIAAQSIGEPGTQLTMRTFHTGGVFSGGLTESIIANYNGWIEYLEPISGTCIRTLQGKIAFLTKTQSSFVLKKGLYSEHHGSASKTTEVSFYRIPGYAVLFARNKQQIFKKQIVAQFSSDSQNIGNLKAQRGNAEQVVYADLEGEIFFNQMDLLEQKSNFFLEDTLWKSNSKSKLWILSGKVYQNFTGNFANFLVRNKDFVNKNSVFERFSWYNSYNSIMEFGLLKYFKNFSGVFSVFYNVKNSSANSICRQSFSKVFPFHKVEGKNFEKTFEGTQTQVQSTLKRKTFEDLHCGLHNAGKTLQNQVFQTNTGLYYKTAKQSGSFFESFCSFCKRNKNKRKNTNLPEEKHWENNKKANILHIYKNLSSYNLHKKISSKAYFYKNISTKASKLNQSFRLKKFLLKLQKYKSYSISLKTLKLKIFNFKFNKKNRIKHDNMKKCNLFYNSAKLNFSKKYFLNLNNQHNFNQNKWLNYCLKFTIIRNSKRFLNSNIIKRLHSPVPYIYQYDINFRSNFKRKYNRINFSSNQVTKKLVKKFNNLKQKNFKLLTDLKIQRKFIPNFFKKAFLKYSNQKKFVYISKQLIHKADLFKPNKAKHDSQVFFSQCLCFQKWLSLDNHFRKHRSAKVDTFADTMWNTKTQVYLTENFAHHGSWNSQCLCLLDNNKTNFKMLKFSSVLTNPKYSKLLKSKKTLKHVYIYKKNYFKINLKTSFSISNFQKPEISENFPCVFESLCVYTKTFEGNTNTNSQSSTPLQINISPPVSFLQKHRSFEKLAAQKYFQKSLCLHKDLKRSVFDESKTGLLKVLKFPVFVFTQTQIYKAFRPCRYKVEKNTWSTLLKNQTLNIPNNRTFKPKIYFTKLNRFHVFNKVKKTSFFKKKHRSKYPLFVSKNIVLEQSKKTEDKLNLATLVENSTNGNRKTVSDNVRFIPLSYLTEDEKKSMQMHSFLKNSSNGANNKKLNSYNSFNLKYKKKRNLNLISNSKKYFDFISSKMAQKLQKKEFNVKNSNELVFKTPILFLSLSKIRYASLSYILDLKKYSLKSNLSPIQNDKILAFFPLNSAENLKKTNKNIHNTENIKPNLSPIFQWFPSDFKANSGLFILSKIFKKYNLKNDFWIQRKRNNLFATQKHKTQKIFLLNFKQIFSQKICFQYFKHEKKFYQNLATDQVFQINTGLPYNLSKDKHFRKMQQTVKQSVPFAVPSVYFESLCVNTKTFEVNTKTDLQKCFVCKYNLQSCFLHYKKQRKGCTPLQIHSGKTKLLKFKAFCLQTNKLVNKEKALNFKLKELLSKQKYIKKLRKNFLYTVKKQTILNTKNFTLKKLSVFPETFHWIAQENFQFISINKNLKKNSSLNTNNINLSAYLVNRQGRKKLFNRKLSGLITFSQKSSPCLNFKSHIGNNNIKFVNNKKVQCTEDQNKLLKTSLKKFNQNRFFNSDFMSKRNEIKLNRTTNCSLLNFELKNLLIQNLKKKLVTKASFSKCFSLEKHRFSKAKLWKTVEPLQTKCFQNLIEKRRFGIETKAKQTLLALSLKSKFFTYIAYQNQSSINNENFQLKENTKNLLLKEKLNVTVKPGWVYVFTKENNKVFAFHQVFIDSGKNWIHDIIFQQNSIYVETCIHKTFSSFICKPKISLKTKVKIFTTQISLKALKPRYIVFENTNLIKHKQKSKLGLLIRPIKSKILPNLLTYKNYIHKANTSSTKINLSYTLMKNYHSNLLNKQKKLKESFFSKNGFHFKISKITVLKKFQQRMLWFYSEKKILRKSNQKQALINKKSIKIFVKNQIIAKSLGKSFNKTPFNFFIKNNFLKNYQTYYTYKKFFYTSFHLKAPIENKNFYFNFPKSFVQISSKQKNFCSKNSLDNQNRQNLKSLQYLWQKNCVRKFSNTFSAKGIKEKFISSFFFPVYKIKNTIETKISDKKHINCQLLEFNKTKYKFHFKTSIIDNRCLTSKIFVNQPFQHMSIAEVTQNLYLTPYFKWFLLKKTTYLGNQRLCFKESSNSLKKQNFQYRNSFLFYEFNGVLKNQVFANTDILSPFEGELVEPYFAEKSWWNSMIDGFLINKKQKSNHKIFLTKKDIFSVFIPKFDYFSNYMVKQNNILKKNFQLTTKLKNNCKATKIKQLKVKFNTNYNLRLQKKKILALILKEGGQIVLSLISNSNDLEVILSLKFKQKNYESSLKRIFSKHSINQNNKRASNLIHKGHMVEFFTTYKKQLYKLKGLEIGKPNRLNKLSLGNFLFKGDFLNPSTSFNKTGQILHFNLNKITLRSAQCFLVSPKGILHVHQADSILKNVPIITLPFDTFTTGDIVQGIPKVEQYLEARTSQNGRPFLYSLPILLQGIFKRYCTKFPLEEAVSQSFLKIQLIIVDGVQRVYRSQGVSIADKHLEVIVKQMTSKVQILHGGQTGFFPGELVDREVIERINPFLMIKIQYEPVVLGITRASLEVESFLSAASFQQTTKILAKASLYKKKDFLKGLKENILIGNLIPAGTGYMKAI
uniref:DNA-directed RNA polymerase subunit beta'' n=1 Tax=Neochloris aquatica TaxID=3099 RepID=A0A140H9H9_9CHLO|nr:RNA polymerase beta subunit [Neochloris aquatica]AMO00828.1 RNA polymerase beta subunit [Neochloris aquatica]